MKENIYVSPEVDVELFMFEKGFEISGVGYEDGEDDGFVDTY